MNCVNKCLNYVNAGAKYGVDFCLNVLGAGGAVWGSSEFFGLRDSNDPVNNRAWQVTAISVSAVALGYFCSKKHGERISNCFSEKSVTEEKEPEEVTDLMVNGPVQDKQTTELPIDSKLEKLSVVTLR